MQGLEQGGTAQGFLFFSSNVRSILLMTGFLWVAGNIASGVLVYFLTTRESKSLAPLTPVIKKDKNKNKKTEKDFDWPRLGHTPTCVAKTQIGTDVAF